MCPHAQHNSGDHNSWLGMLVCHGRDVQGLRAEQHVYGQDGRATSLCHAQRELKASNAHLAVVGAPNCAADLKRSSRRHGQLQAGCVQCCIVGHGHHHSCCRRAVWRPRPRCPRQRRRVRGEVGHPWPSTSRGSTRMGNTSQPHARLEMRTRLSAEEARRLPWSDHAPQRRSAHQWRSGIAGGCRPCSRPSDVQMPSASPAAPLAHASRGLRVLENCNDFLPIQHACPLAICQDVPIYLS